MDRKQYLLLVVITLIAGFIGGAVSNRAFMSKTAEAQETQKHEKVIVAEEFRLVDRAGRTRAILGEGDFFNSSAESAGLWVYDKKGQTRAGLAVYTEGTPGLFLFDSNSNISLLLEVSENYYPQMIFSTRGKEVLRCGSKTEGVPFLHLKSDAGKLQICLDILDGEPSLSIYGTEAESEWLYIGSASIKIRDARGEIRAALGSVETEITATGETRKRALSSLVLFDKDGKIIWSTP